MYFTVCEALTNVAKYARATRAWVKVERRHRSWTWWSATTAWAAPRGRRFRAPGPVRSDRRVNGTLESRAEPAAGTVLRVWMPV